MSADLYFTGIRLLSFFRPRISELVDRNSTISGHMVGSKCDLKMHVRNLAYAATYKSGAPKLFFWRFCNLRPNFTAYIFGMKRDIHKRTSTSQTTTRSPTSSQNEMTWTLVHIRLQIGGEFSPTLHKFCIPLHCQASQTEINKRNSTKFCQTVEVGRANNLP